MIILSGCSSISELEYHENGKVKRIYTKEGFVDWSAGSGKTINMPASHISGINTK